MPAMRREVVARICSMLIHIITLCVGACSERWWFVVFQHGISYAYIALMPLFRDKAVYSVVRRVL